MTGDGNGDGGASTIDPTTVEHVLRMHPVQIGVLFGSQAGGIVTAESDVDVAVLFDDTLSTDERHRARLDLIGDLMAVLGRNEVDVLDLEHTRPAVGASALRTGVVLVGNDDRVEQLRDEFETHTSDRSHAERMRQFDEILARLEEAV